MSAHSIVRRLRRALDPVFMVGSDLIVATVALRAEREAWVRAIEVSARPVAQGTDDIVVTARFVLGGSVDPATRPLLLDGRTCPFPITRLESETLTPTQRITGRREPLLSFDPVAQGWDGASFELDILWLAGHRDFVLPNMLPHLSRAVPGRPRPTIRVHGNGRDRLVLAGIPLAPGKVAWGSPMIEAVLVRGKAVVRRRLVFTEMLAAEFDEQQIQRSEELANLILGFFERDLGVTPGVRVAARAGNEHLGERLRGGSCIVLDDRRLGLGPASGTPDDLLWAFQLASVWWGGGCQVTGRRHEELLMGIQIFLALRWLGWMDSDKVPATLERLRAYASLGFFESRSYAVREGYRRDLSSRCTLALYEAAEQSTGVMDTLRQLTREAWGNTVSAEFVVDRFRNVGVPVTL